MAEYIEKAAIVARIEERSREWGEEYDAEQILGDIEDFPAADVVERKTGTWISKNYRDEWYGFIFKCSLCGFEMPRNFNYCPNCGARMEG